MWFRYIKWWFIFSNWVLYLEMSLVFIPNILSICKKKHKCYHVWLNLPIMLLSWKLETQKLYHLPREKCYITILRSFLSTIKNLKSSSSFSSLFVSSFLTIVLTMVMLLPFPLFSCLPLLLLIPICFKYYHCHCLIVIISIV